jgi:hypothetical protein
MKRSQFSLRGLMLLIVVIAGSLAWLKAIDPTHLQLFAVCVVSAAYVAAALIWGTPRSVRASRARYQVAYFFMQVFFFYAVCNAAAFILLPLQDAEILTSQEFPVFPHGDFRDSFTSYDKIITRSDLDPLERLERMAHHRNLAKDAFQRRTSMAFFLSIAATASMLFCCLCNLFAAVGIAPLRWHLLLTVPAAITAVILIPPEYLMQII